ncbi:MAG: FAD-binding oxidoreductase [Amphritea sp.]
MSASTYPSYKRPCGWVTPDDAPITSPILQGTESCDAVIIGAGYTGLAIAQHLTELRPEDDIRVLDAEQIGTGSPGRNSGFVLDNAFAAKSSAAAQTLYQQYSKTHQELAARAALPSQDKSPTHIFKGAATPRGIKSLDLLVKHLSDTKQPFEKLDAKKVRQITGTNYYKAGVMLPGSRLLNPYQLIRALAHQLPANVTLHAESPALSVEKHEKGWQITTPKGVLKAPKVYLANNAFAKNLGFGKGHSVTIYTYAGVTAPLNSDERAKITSAGQWGVLPAHRLGSTLRTTDDGRLLIRGMYGYEKEGGREVEQILQQSLSKRFPHISAAHQLEDCWGGTTSLTSNGAPLWGELKPGLYASIGCNGVGILKGWMLGRELAQLSCKQSTLDIPGLFGKPGWMPPEPFRQMGFLAVSEVEKRMAGDEK